MKTCSTCWYWAVDGETVRIRNGFCKLNERTTGRMDHCDHWCSLAKGPKRITLDDIEPDLD